MRTRAVWIGAVLMVGGLWSASGVSQGLADEPAAPSNASARENGSSHFLSYAHRGDTGLHRQAAPPPMPCAPGAHGDGAVMVGSRRETQEEGPTFGVEISFDTCQ